MNMKYRKKPVVIEAIIFNGENVEELRYFTKDFTNEVLDIKITPTGVLHIGVKTLEGMMKVNVGDYVIKGINGEFYPCKPDIFEKTYEKVE